MNLSEAMARKLGLNTLFLPFESPMSLLSWLNTMNAANWTWEYNQVPIGLLCKYDYDSAGRYRE